MKIYWLRKFDLKNHQLSFSFFFSIKFEPIVLKSVSFGIKGCQVSSHSFKLLLIFFFVAGKASSWCEDISV